MSIMNERFSRIERLLGSEGLARLQDSYVVVVGLGAVGGFAAEALARSGVGRLRLVDFDIFTPGNINRQICALGSTLGRAKVDVFAERIIDINPGCKVEPLQIFAHIESFDSIFDDMPDLVIDAIDSFNPKVELLNYLQSRQIPVISSMGAALRRDPSKIVVGELTNTTCCPLAKLLRKNLRRRRASTNIMCVYSTEPRSELPDDAVVDENESEDNFLDRGRKRRELGSLPTITGIFGLTIANKAIELLTHSGK